MRRVAQVARELLVPLARLVLRARRVAQVAQVARELLAPLAQLVPLARLVLRARRVAQAAQGPLDLLVQLDPLERKELLGQAEGRQEPLGLLAPLVLLLRLEQMAKYNITTAALQWAELQSFTITTLQIE